MKEIVIHIRIDAELHKDLKKAAQDDGRTLSNLIRKVLEGYAKVLRIIPNAGK